jgi:hypothetical protein
MSEDLAKAAQQVALAVESWIRRKKSGRDEASTEDYAWYRRNFISRVRLTAHSPPELLDELAILMERLRGGIKGSPAPPAQGTTPAGQPNDG